MLKSDVVAHFKTFQAIADVLEITRSAVQQWPEIVPEGSAYKLQVITAGLLRVDPSLYPSQKKVGALTSVKCLPQQDDAGA